MSVARAARPRILIVDDEEQVTRSLRLVLRKQFNVETAGSGEEGLDRIEAEEEFDVVVSDMRMPGMNGAEFLKRAREATPESIRILLTGQADAESAMEAVNEGRIFRFMSKPCSPTALRAVLDEAVEYRAQLSAERDVLEHTLRSFGLVLSDVIGTIHPTAARRSEQLRSAVRQLAPQVGIEATWRVELAAALANLGCVALPSPLVDSALRGKSLASSDKEAWTAHAECGASLIEGVPRLEGVADMIRGHARPTDELKKSAEFDTWTEETRGAELLRTVNAYLTGVASGKEQDAILGLMKRSKSFAGKIVEAIETLPVERSTGREVTLRADRLVEGMTLLDDMKSREGVVLCCAGAVVSETLCKLAVNFSIRGELREPIRVLLEESAEDEETTP